MTRIGREPFGVVLLGVIAGGLVGFALWRFVQAAQDPDGRGSDLKGWTLRAGYAFSGLVHCALAWGAARLALGLSRGVTSEQSQEEWTAWLMSFPFGVWLVGLVGAGIVAFGIGQFVLAYRARFMLEYQLFEMSEREVRWSKRMGQFGNAARGVVFVIVGGFLIGAAWHTNPAEATGLGGALDALARQPFGPWLMGATALGWAAYGIFCFTRARYRYFEVE
jgi:hypothetical protein